MEKTAIVLTELINDDHSTRSFNCLIVKSTNLYLVWSNWFNLMWLLPRLRFRLEMVYDQTQSSAHPCVPRPKLQGLDGSSNALQSGRWSGDGLIRGNFGQKGLIIGGFERTWVWSEATSSAIGSDHKLFERTWVWSEKFSNAIGSDRGQFRAHYFFIFLFFTERCWLCQEATVKQRSDQRPFWSPIALIRKKSPIDSKGRSPSEEILINWRPRCFIWKAV